MHLRPSEPAVVSAVEFRFESAMVPILAAAFVLYSGAIIYLLWANVAIWRALVEHWQGEAEDWAGLALGFLMIPASLPWIEIFRHLLVSLPALWTTYIVDDAGIRIIRGARLRRTILWREVNRVVAPKYFSEIALHVEGASLPLVLTRGLRIGKDDRLTRVIEIVKRCASAQLSSTRFCI